MKIVENTPVKEYNLLPDIYAEYDIENNTISIPRPFTAEHFTALREELGVDPDGLAGQVNQLMAKNITNAITSRARSVHTKNAALADAQAKGERADEEFSSLPTQATVDELVEAYNFTGIRLASNKAAVVTPFEKELTRLVKQLIKNLLKISGFQGRPGPITVAKKSADPTETQISFEDFLSLVQSVVDGEGNWGTDTLEDGSPSPYYAKRQALIAQAETNIAAVQMDVEAVSSELTAG